MRFLTFIGATVATVVWYSYYVVEQYLTFFQPQVLRGWLNANVALRQWLPDFVSAHWSSHWGTAIETAFRTRIAEGTLTQVEYCLLVALALVPLRLLGRVLVRYASNGRYCND